MVVVGGGVGVRSESPEESACVRFLVVVDRKVALRRIRVISFSAETPAKRALGRPKGSLGSKKRDALLRDELARWAAVVV